MSIKVQPLADRVVVQPIEWAEMTKGGIVLPDTAKKTDGRRSNRRAAK